MYDRILLVLTYQVVFPRQFPEGVIQHSRSNGVRIPASNSLPLICGTGAFQLGQAEEEEFSEISPQTPAQGTGGCRNWRSRLSLLSTGPRDFNRDYDEYSCRCGSDSIGTGAGIRLSQIRYQEHKACSRRSAVGLLLGPAAVTDIGERKPSRGNGIRSKGKICNAGSRKKSI